MPDSWPEEIEASAHVADVDTWSVKFVLPVPTVVLAGRLLERIPRRVGVKNGHELVAALLVRAAQETDEGLGEIVGDYRDTRVYTILDPTAKAGAIVIPPRAEVELT
jgi:hypothetical protein